MVVFFVGDLEHHDLVSGAVAGYDFDGGFGEFQKFGEKGDAHLVGGAFYGRGGELDFQGVRVGADHRVFGGSGLDEHFDENSFGFFG